MCHKTQFFLWKEEQDAMFLISEYNFNSLTVKGKKEFLNVCSTLNLNAGRITLWQGFECRWMLVELICYVKIIIVFYKFYDFFCRRCYNNLFQFMQHDNFRNLNRLIFTHWKQLQSRVNVFWVCFLVIKRWNRFPLRKPELFWLIYGVIKVYDNCLIYGVIKV